MATGRNQTPVSPERAEAEMTGRPRRGQAEDGRTGGQSQGGHLGRPNSPGDGTGTNAQTGKRSGSESEREAPGISTDKKADDTR